MSFASREHPGHDDRAGVHRTALERIVEILAMRRGSVDKGGTCRAEGARMAERRAWAFIVAAGSRAADVVRVTGRNTKPGDIDQQIFDFFAQRIGDDQQFRRLGKDFATFDLREPDIGYVRDLRGELQEFRNASPLAKFAESVRKYDRAVPVDRDAVYFRLGETGTPASATRTASG